MLFGGTGKNFVNPAITGRVFLVISFGGAVASGWLAPSIPALIETGSAVPSLLDMFLGTGMLGCIGETSKLALIIGGVYLVVIYKTAIDDSADVKNYYDLTETCFGCLKELFFIG